MAFKGKASGSAAWHLDEADDPADWNDSFRFLRQMDASLRCELCYNILTAPVAVKECNHVFCSVCVRNAINQPDPHGHHCPKCMAKNVHDSSLVPQPIIETSAEAWKIARPELFKKQQEEEEEPRSKEEVTSSRSLDPDRPTKRARRSEPSSEVEGERAGEGRVTRSGSLRQARKAVEESITIESDTDEDGAAYDPRDVKPPSTKRGNGVKQTEDKDYRSMQATDMVECPVCQHTFTLVALHQHLDKGCQPGDPEPSMKERGLPTMQGTMTTKGASSWFQRGNNESKSSPPDGSPVRSRKKLARPNYTFLKEVDIRRMLEEYKLSTSGSKDRLIERHRLWVTLYNANLDASARLQKSDVKLRKDIAEWERGQEDGVKGSKGKVGAMTEEKAKAWQEANGDQFRDLEKKARESHFKNKAAHHQTLEQGEPHDGQEERVESDSKVVM